MGLIRVGKLWPSRRIPFTVSKEAQKAGAAAILGAVADWNRNTVISLMPLADWIGSGGRVNAPRIHFVSSIYGVVCNSGVGYKDGDVQQIKCFQAWNVGTLVHEIGHALGLYHEQQRTDRDRFVLVNPIAAGAGYESNYAKRNAPYALPEGPYDCRSIMHYNLQPPRIMVRATGSPCSAFGGRRRSDGAGGQTWLSPGDIATINKWYKNR